MTPLQMKKLLKKTKIRECQVDLNRLTISNSVDFREAVFQKYKIRNLDVRLFRLSEEYIQEVTKGKKRLEKSKSKSVRSNVSWIPMVRNNSIQMLSTLNAYHELNGIMPTKSGKGNPKIEPAKRGRAKSLFIDRTKNTAAQTTKEPITTPNGVRFTMDDFHKEFNSKYAITNHGLIPTSNRLLADAPPKPDCVWKKLFDEFQAKRATKQTAANRD